MEKTLIIKKKKERELNLYLYLNLKVLGSQFFKVQTRLVLWF